MLPLITQAQTHHQRIAIASTEGTFTYQDLLDRSAQIATTLLQPETTNPQTPPDLQEQRIAFLIPSGFTYVATQWGIWRSGGIAVPLCTVHPRPELEYVIQQSGATTLIAHPDFADLLRPIATDHNLQFLLTTDFLVEGRGWEAHETGLPPSSFENSLPDIDPQRRALILYTSGTTGKPKGVVTTHRTIQAQVTSLVTAWEWTEADRILHVLPLHHIHGIVNVLTCALWVGAQCHMLPKFDAETVWDRLAAGDLTLFMAVPTIYAKLIAAWEKAPGDRQQHWTTGCRNLRLMVSGSAALPVQVLTQWQQISGHFLLERYGMTEIGMALSNPLKGERLPGCVGQPLPHVQVRLVDDRGEPVPAGTPGEIQVKGPSVFLEYWQNREATAKAFDGGWFRTGDLAIVEDSTYRILGRISVDIIKTGGYKVSALEIEEVLRTHPHIQDCAVVGVADPEWGERVCAAIVGADAALSLETLRDWAKERLAVYKVPTRLVPVAELPRNAMGKVTKPAVVDLFS